MRRDERGYRQDGFILIIVLGAVLTLSALLFGFNQAARTNLNVADSLCRTEQLRNSAWAGLQIAVATIRDTDNIYAEPRFASLLSGENTFPIGDTVCSVTIAEESGLLNINRLKDENGQLNRKRVDQFLRLIDLLNRREKDAQRIGYGVVPALVDWVDADDEVTHLPFVQGENLGAENDHYQTQDPAYSCRNEPVAMLDELRWVKGVTPEALRRLRPLLTCTGDGRININAAPKPIIESLSERIDAALAQMIVNQRRLRPFRTPAELRSVPGMTDNVFRTIQDVITVSPDERYYRVVSQATAQDRKYTMEAVLRRNTQAGNVDIILYREP
jgi:general secretion pathway protein K